MVDDREVAAVVEQEVDAPGDHLELLRRVHRPLRNGRGEPFNRHLAWLFDAFGGWVDREIALTNKSPRLVYGSFRNFSPPYLST